MEQRQANDLTEALLDIAGVAAQILAHMARWQGRSDPDAPPPETVFRELVGGVVRPVLERHPPAARAAAAEVLTDAVAAIEAEVLLVEPPPVSRGRSRRSGPSRRPR